MSLGGLGVDLLFHGFVLALCALLLVRGARQWFVWLFGAAALLRLLGLLGPDITSEGSNLEPATMLIIARAGLINALLAMLLELAAFTGLAAFLLKTERPFDEQQR